MSRLTLLLFAISELAIGYKFVLFALDLGNSQIMFTKRVAETLADAGHNVTMVLVQALDGRRANEIKIKKDVNLYHVTGSIGVTRQEFEEQQASIIFEDYGLFDRRAWKSMEQGKRIAQGSCRNAITNHEFLTWLKSQQFDVAFLYMYQACPVGIVHLAHIPSWVWLISSPMADHVAQRIGMPTIPSYVPPLPMESHDTMTFYERTKSFIGHVMIYLFWDRVIVNPEMELFRDYVDPSFPHLDDLARKCPLVMVNSNELYELPRPTLAKVISIGGLGIQLQQNNPLPEKIEEIVAKANGIIVFSFGSLTPAKRMPEPWKEAFFKAFSQFPYMQFFVKYDGDDVSEMLSSNVHIMKWLPQTDLLYHPKTKVFITHAGYNSVQEAIHAGVPMICLALFGDQPKNAKVTEKLGISVNLKKIAISEETVAAAIQEVLSNKRYGLAIKRLARMIRKRPVSSRDLLVRWSEFLAEFKTLENLVPAGTKLNWIQYHSIDSVLFLAAIGVLIGLVLYSTLKLFVTKLHNILLEKDKHKVL